MKLPKHQVWKWRIALVILVAWICLDGVEIITSAEVRPPRRERGLMINPEDLKKKEEITVDIGKRPRRNCAACKSSERESDGRSSACY